MTGFADYERGGGKPVEVYVFTQGTTMWRWTSGDSAVMVGGETYLPEALKRGRLEMNEEARTGTVDVRAPSSNEVVRLFARSQPTTPVLVQIFRVQLDDLTLAPDTIFAGQVEYCKFSPRAGLLHCVPMESIASRKLAILSYQTTCNNSLFDNRCQVPRADFTYAHDVTDFADADPSAGLGYRVTLDASALSYFTGAFESLLVGGVATFGDQKRTIIGHTGDVIYLMSPFDDLLIGSTIEVTAGCPKTVTACRDIFDNRLRFLGFPHIPQRNPFEGSGLE